MPGFGLLNLPQPPAPGQTVSSGSWTGPAPSAPTSTATLAQGAGITRVPRPQTYNKGTTNVQPKKGRGMGVPGYAEGTASVPAAYASAPAATAQPGFLDRILPYISVGNPANPLFSLGTPQGAAAPTPMGGQAGDFQMHGMPQPISPVAPAMPQGQPGGSLTQPPLPVVASPAPGQGAGNPGWNANGPAPFPQLGSRPFVPPAGDSPDVNPQIEAAFRAGPAALQATVQGQITHPNGMVKQDDNPVGTAVTAAVANSSALHAHAMSQPHQYSQDEFVDALRGVPLATIEKLYGMQHYQTPQAQIAPRFLQTQANRTAQLEQEYGVLNQPNADQAKLSAKGRELQAQKDYYARAVAQIALGPGALTMGGIQVPQAPE